MEPILLFCGVSSLVYLHWKEKKIVGAKKGTEPAADSSILMTHMKPQRSTSQVMRHSADLAEDTLLRAVRRYKWSTIPVIAYAASYILFTILTLYNNKYEQDESTNSLSLVICIYINYISVNSIALYSVMWMFMKHMQSAYQMLYKVCQRDAKVAASQLPNHEMLMSNEKFIEQNFKK